MFESAELGHAVDAKAYDAEVPKLREALLAAQAEVLERKQFPVIVLISGVEGAGKGDTLHTIHEWMDPRHIETHAFDAPDCVEAEHPPMWRYWTSLPRAGRLGVFFRAWYRDPIHERVFGAEKRVELERRLDAIVSFERMLTDEGALVVKYWLHLSRKQQRKRLEALAADKATRWQVKKSDWRNHEHYDELRALAEQTLRRTSTQHAPWIVIEGNEERYRRLTVGRVLLDAIKARLKAPKAVPVRAPPIVAAVDNRKRLRDLDSEASLAAEGYEKRLARAQGSLASLSRRLARTPRSLVLAFEGPDAGGKGGAIRRVTAALDARYYSIIATGAPNEEERAHPYLWRFWRYVPRSGRTTVFDRTWYGRVLVERVEKLAQETAWMRAYSEINDFEAQLTEHGAVVLKFWLHVTKDEQLRRFRSREDEGYKRFKITGEDWRNRKRWDAYEQAACDMFDRTSTRDAPWTVVPANDKRFARVMVLETVVKALKEAL
jgi:polyphosphate:AMP phosphotransferase